jgi:hypothetical protein
VIRPGDVQIPRIPFTQDTHYKFQELIDKTVTPGPPGWSRDDDGRLRVRCACGYWMACTNHRIDEDGTMFASWLHPKDDALDCGYHVMARLVDWDQLGHGPALS